MTKRGILLCIGLVSLLIIVSGCGEEKNDELPKIDCNQLNETECSNSEYCYPEYITCEQEEPTCIIDLNNESNSYCYDEPCSAFHKCVERNIIAHEDSSIKIERCTNLSFSIAYKNMKGLTPEGGWQSIRNMNLITCSELNSSGLIDKKIKELERKLNELE